MRIKVKAFGCKLTQCEAGEIERGLISAGFDIVESPPFDIVIVCGCTVTARADYKVRQYLRRVKRDYGARRLILSGCSAQNINQEKVSELSIDKLFPKNDTAAIAEYLKSQIECNSCSSINNIDCNINSLNYDNRTRGSVKIQDGCNQFCSYCIVPYVRGREYSIPPSDIIDNINALSEKGIREVVLTGVHIGRYSHSGKKLIDLCELISKKTDIFRIRLSSIEPIEVSEDLIDFIKSSPKIAPHLHIPLQSGSNNILYNMNRPYTRERYFEVISKVYSKVNNIGIGADVIVGFPGESEADFRATYELIESLPISYLHVFRYSMRTRTAAYMMQFQVDDSVKRDRMERLKALDQSRRVRFAKSQFNIAQEVIIERIQNDHCEGLTGNYLKANFISHSVSNNNIVVVEPISYENGVINCNIKHTI